MTEVPESLSRMLPGYKSLQPKENLNQYMYIVDRYTDDLVSVLGLVLVVRTLQQLTEIVL